MVTGEVVAWLSDTEGFFGFVFQSDIYVQLSYGKQYFQIQICKLASKNN